MTTAVAIGVAIIGGLESDGRRLALPGAASCRQVGTFSSTAAPVRGNLGVVQHMVQHNKGG
jgi:hypothetical protein